MTDLDTARKNKRIKIKNRASKRERTSQDSKIELKS